ncbi:hypothetical protein [Rhizobium leguminosarum]|uniref:hypothetical protein n=1 Tax=Rhizobium leguminosarum TaxID=384 RepID=UPI003F9AD0D4
MQHISLNTDPDLRPYLVFNAPAQDRKDFTIGLNRSRQVKISWEKIVSPSGVGTPYKAFDGSQAFKVWAERLWGISDPNDDDVVMIKNNYVASIGPSYLTIQMGPEGQRWVLFARSETPFTQSEFDTAASYQAFWPKVDRVVVASDTLSWQEELDLSPAVIWRQYRDLINMKSLSDIINLRADEFANASITGFLQQEELAVLASQYITMKGMRIDVEESLRRLKDQAEDLGYVLNITQTPITYKFPGGVESDVVEPGELYQPYMSTVSWWTSHQRREVSFSSSWFSSSISVHVINYQVLHRQSVQRYRKKIIDFDPWVEKERSLLEQGFRSFRFARTGNGYVTADGVTLEEVMLLCDRDMFFWESSVIWLPVYDQKFTQGEVLAKYIIIYRPLRGAQLVHLPRFYLEEQLSVRRDPSVSVELGELAHTINLAPGEKRTITIERSSTNEREERRSAKSLVDVVDVSSTDFATEFEREARHETESNRSTNWSVKASGSYGAFSGGAEGGGTSSLKVNDFARNLEKIAQKAARSITRKTQDEISTSLTSKTTSSSSEKNVLEVENINLGRSLNLAFYRMNNVSSVGIYLEDLEFVLLPGIEAVAGTGIVLPEVFPLSDLRRALDRLSINAMPFSPVADPGDARRTFGRRFLLDLIEAVGEYSPFAGGGLATIKNDVTNYVPTKDADSKALGKHVKKLQNYLHDTEINQNPIGTPQKLVSGSAGFYLDSFVGQRPSTEPYSDESRDLELIGRAADIAETRARAAYYLNLAAPALTSSNSVVATANSLRQLKVVFADKPKKGKWELYVDRAHTDRSFDVTDPNTKDYTLNWAEDQSWLDPRIKNIAQLVHLESQEIVAFFI